ncbi:MAG: spore coat U domain-containing protein [Klebsiella michiganensis]|uniref:Csu type fimbrial protein n=1 Tax=Klebsiella TaxID=570 RepID=UPI001CCEFF09|nr:spore coat U domain-containing protein [Klebsiella grimontii]MBZ7467746.1 spore coat protein U domain-containing protein [Klebsiella grimontii]MDU3692588.1 spore coat U domain-containing protein [Klebsiella michiganensis]MDU3714698.1 spore coat U domain-containing protein [Klebsiella michiganensis]
MRKLILSLAVFSGLTAAPAMAATTTGTLTVQALVQSSCYLDSAGANLGNALLDFGTVTNLEKEIDAKADTAASALSVICTNGTTYDVSADLGSNANDQQRQMSNGNDHLPYVLYSDAVRSTQISNGTTFASGIGNGLSKVIPVYGRIPAGTALPSPGSYVDTVTLTVTY